MVLSFSLSNSEFICSFCVAIHILIPEFAGLGLMLNDMRRERSLSQREARRRKESCNLTARMQTFLGNQQHSMETNRCVTKIRGRRLQEPPASGGGRRGEDVAHGARRDDRLFLCKTDVDGTIHPFMGTMCSECCTPQR
eukprot:3773082-Amphidinium_carterae.1